MGLAASQARFLGITARKSNIEYEGQQVNQQRTALAEEVNSLYGRLTALKVPVAPSPEEYYETNYTFELEGTSEAKYDGSYKIKNYYKTEMGYHVDYERTYTAVGATANWINRDTIYTKDDEGTTTYYYKPTGTQTSYALTAMDPSSQEYNTYKNHLKEAGAYRKYDPETGTYIDDEEIMKADSLYYYQDEKTGACIYFSKYQMDNKANVDVYYYNIGNKTKTVSGSWENVQIEMDANGRIKNITLPSEFPTTKVNTTRTSDTEGFEAALRDYTMRKDEYDKEIENINAKTKSLQQEDKVLELRLNQIDTEQNELATELDAVKQVLDKNIESTFKTFA